MRITLVPFLTFLSACGPGVSGDSFPLCLEAYKQILNDGRVPIEKNNSERPSPTGRPSAGRTGLLVGSDDGGVNVTLVSLLPSCEMHRIEPSPTSPFDSGVGLARPIEAQRLKLLS